MLLCNLLILFLLLHTVLGRLLASEKIKFCEHLECDQVEDKRVCGIRVEGRQTILKIFNNECDLLRFGCEVDDDKAYGIINMEHCEITGEHNYKTANKCDDCLNDNDTQQICGIRKDGEGFRIRTFDNECQLLKHNCERNLSYHVTDLFICNQSKIYLENVTQDVEDENNDIAMNDETVNGVRNDTDGNITIKNVFILDGSMIDKNNINESVDRFFAATHVFDLPMQEMQPYLNESTRRMLLRVAGPVKVFRPWVTIPKNISDDHHHRPTLSSCYHKCPTKCPETYAPVCGVPGIVAREPSLMFKNHCFMDVAQCKMHWEDKSDTAVSSAYIESSFLFCLGDEMNGLYRFLPLIRTLQHMGRLKTKGKFRYKLKNMRFFNNLLSREPRIMG